VTVSERRIRVEPHDVEDWERIFRELGTDIVLETVPWEAVKDVSKTVQDLYYPHINIRIERETEDGVVRTQEKRIFFTTDETEILNSCFKAIKRMRSQWRQYKASDDERFPDEIKIGWDFWPLQEPGLCMIFFAATGLDGEHVLDSDLEERTGIYGQYGNGDINALHLSYFRRNHHGPEGEKNEIEFQTVNLRKSKGFHLVQRGGDPIPSVKDANSPYRIEVVKYGSEIAFHVDGVEVLHWVDDGETYGPPLEDGNIGFRQMAPTMAEYGDLTVHAVEKTD